jgi:site-specific recombinase XerD
MNIYEAVEQFITSLKKNHYSPLTISSYDLTIKEFIKFSKLEKAEQLSRAILAPYKEHINENEKRSSKTKNLKLIPVRRFIQFLNDQEITDVSYDVLSLVRSKNGRQPLDLISHEELKTFLEYKDTPKNDFLVNLLYYTGLRVAELRALNIQDIKPEFKICGKGGRTRIIFINQKVMKMFNIYKGDRTDGPIFTGYGEKRMSVRNMERIVAKRAEYLGMSKKMSPHSLRHLYATHLNEKGAELKVIQELLGHASLMTTQIYTHVNAERMREAHKKL